MRFLLVAKTVDRSCTLPERFGKVECTSASKSNSAVKVASCLLVLQGWIAFSQQSLHIVRITRAYIRHI